MAWHDILGQTQAVGLLQRAIKSERVAHAYLFHGPDGTGKRAAAVELAATLLCSRKKATVHACGRCTNCTGAYALRHPDLHILLPQPLDATPDEVAACIRALAENPYAVVEVSRRSNTTRAVATNKQSFYSVRQVSEELHSVLSLHPALGGYHVAVIVQADAMREPAANALLKLLEEPEARTVLILTTSRTDRLLPTVLSRCQRVRFGLLDEETVARALEERQGTDRESARLYARMAGGSYSAAVDLLASSEMLKKARDDALYFLGHSYTRRAGNMTGVVDGMIQGGRDHVKSVLEHALILIRDLLLLHTLGDEASITNVDQESEIVSFASRLQSADFYAIARLVEEGHRLVGRELNLRVLLITLAHAVGRAMRGKGAGALYLPLAQR